MNEWTDETIFEKLKNILAQALEVDVKTITPDTLIINDLGAESIDFLDISFRIEETFKIKISEKSFSTKAQNIPEGKSVGEFFSVQIIIDFLKDKLKEKNFSDLKV